MNGLNFLNRFIMADRSFEKTIIIGVGNEERGDDAVGLLVARELRKKTLPGVTVHEVHSDLTLLLNAWEDADGVFLIDAVSSGAEPGTLRRFEAHRKSLPTGDIFRCSTHGASVAEVIELARALRQLPKRLVIYGIEGTTFRLGEAVSQRAAAGVVKAIDAIVAELHQFRADQ